MNINFNYSSHATQPQKRGAIAFKGYDARPLNCVLMTACDDPGAFESIKEVSEIGKKDGFKVYFTNQTNRVYSNLNTIKNFFNERMYAYCKWAQDHGVVTLQNDVLTHTVYEETGIAERIAGLTKGTYKCIPQYIEGGNLFFVKNGDKNELFVGSEESPFRNIDTLKKIYGVSDVHIIPQADYHLDLFIRPLNNKKVLVADDKLTIKEIQKGIRNIEKYKKSHNCSESQKAELDKVKEGLSECLKEFKKEVKICQNPTADDVSKVLEEKGFEALRVPGRLYFVIPNRIRDDLTQEMNYINAVVHEKKDNSLTYITNKSGLNKKYGITPEISEKIDFDFEKMFVKYLEPYIKKEDIHFISGNGYVDKGLKFQQGGIHCLCNEIPQEIFEKTLSAQ